MSAENRVIMLVGPTSVGKTSVSILLARALGTEIIGSDSMQIYRHMDIGTEKPSPLQRTQAVHHMIDMVEPQEEYSTGRYIEAVKPVIERLHTQGRIPLITGGTGLYIKAMTRGLFDGPSADWDLRAELEQSTEEDLYARLMGLDPECASTVMPEDKRRIIRALEVCLISGQKISGLKSALTHPLPYEFIKIGLTREREELYRLIETRVDGLIGRGLLEEVRALMEHAPCRITMQAIGYKEIAAHLRGEITLDEAVSLIRRNTRRYAKRQLTWFRAEPGIRWVDVTGIVEPEAMYARVARALEESGIMAPSSVV